MVSAAGLCAVTSGSSSEHGMSWGCVRNDNKTDGSMQENSSEKVFSQRSQISVDKRSRQWPVWNDLKSQDAAPKQKQQTFPVKKKRLWLNCYSLSDHHNESTTRRWSKRKSEEHPVYINCVCVCKTLHTSSVSSVPPVENISVSHRPSLVSSSLGLSG